jgi:hypothetical protein
MRETAKHYAAKKARSSRTVTIFVALLLLFGLGAIGPVGPGRSLRPAPPKEMSCRPSTPATCRLLGRAQRTSSRTSVKGTL